MANEVLKWHRPEGILNDEIKQRWENFEEAIINVQNELIEEQIEKEKREKQRKKAEKEKQNEKG